MLNITMGIMMNYGVTASPPGFYTGGWEHRSEAFRNDVPILLLY